MKKILFTTALLWLMISLHAQTNAIQDRLMAPVDTISEALVQLALENSSQIKSAKNVALSNKYNYAKTKTSWLDNISARGNLNEFTIDGSSNGTVTQFPRYNFGVIMPLGIFFSTPKQIKADYHSYQAKVDDVTTLKNIIRRNVLTLYQDYVLNLKLKNIQQQIVNDFKAISSNNEQKFATGQMTLEAFAAANLSYYNAMSRQAGIDHDLEVAKAGLEELIGQRLEDAIFSIRAGHVKLQNSGNR